MTYTVPAGRYGDYSTAFIQAYIDAKIAGVLDAAPEALDTLNELAAAIGDDASFLTTMQTANTTLQTNIDNLSTAASTARTSLQTLLQNAVDAVQADVDNNETVAASAVAAEASARGTALTNLQTTLQGLIDAVQADVDQNESDCDAADAAEAARVDALIASGMWLYADQAAFPAAADNHGRVVHSHADGAQFFAHAGAWVKLANDSQITAVQADVDANEIASDNAEAALSARITTLEADPTTATAVAAVQADVDANETASDAAEAALSGRLDTLEADPTTATAVAAVQTDVDANESDRKTYFDFDSNLTKVINPVRGTGINVGNNIEMIPAAAGGRVEITGDLVLDASDLTDAADDTAAAAAGVIVGQVYHNSGALRVRLS